MQRRETSFVDKVKSFVSAPGPFLITLYSVALMTSMAGMEIFGWATALLGVLYILVDRFSSQKSFSFYRIGADGALIGLLIVALCGFLINAPDADLMNGMGGLRWILLLYLLTYAMDLFPGINKYYNVFLAGATLIACYGIYQHFTGVDLRHVWGLRPESAVTAVPVENSTEFKSVGLFSHHLTYGYSFAMLVCFPFAALLLSQRKTHLFRWTMFLSTTLITLSLIWTYGRGVWLATLGAFFIIPFYISRKIFLVVVLLCATGLGIYYQTSHDFQERVKTLGQENYFSNADRKNLWKANIAMFSDYPWLGVGYKRNEELTGEYFKKIGIQSEFGGHAHNNYFQMLSTTGILGLSCYMFFILSFLLMTLRLWTEIPKTHFWHRVIILGSLGAQVAFHIGGLTQWNFGDAEVNHLFIFILATVAYMNERYARGIVPDDYAI